MIDKNVIRMCGQKYIGKADELNDKKYLKNWLGDLVEDLAGLKTGEFYYKIGDAITKIQTDKFIQTRKQKILRIEEVKEKSFWGSKSNYRLVESEEI